MCCLARAAQSEEVAWTDLQCVLFRLGDAGPLTVSNAKGGGVLNKVQVRRQPGALQF